MSADVASAPLPAPPAPEGLAIWTRGLTKRYGPMVAVDSLDLEVRPGEVFGLLGPNGAGKTTTILMLLGLSEPSSGSVRVVGLDPTRRALDVKRRVGYVPDNVGFYGHLSGRSNLLYTAALNGLDQRLAATRADELLAEVGLADRADDRVRVYSRGMRQRLGIADALVKNPDVLILDEPTIGLDPRGADQILSLVSRLAADRGVAVLLSSHLLGQVQSMCTRIGIFVAGRMVASGTVDDLAAEHGGRFVIEVEVAEDDADLDALIDGLPSVVRREREGSRWTLHAQQDIRRDLAHRLADADLTVIHLDQHGEDLGVIYRRYFAADAAAAQKEEATPGSGRTP